MLKVILFLCLKDKSQPNKALKLLISSFLANSSSSERTKGPFWDIVIIDIWKTSQNGVFDIIKCQDFGVLLFGAQFKICSLIGRCIFKPSGQSADQHIKVFGNGRHGSLSFLLLEQLGTSSQMSLTHIFSSHLCFQVLTWLSHQLGPSPGFSELVTGMDSLMPSFLGPSWIWH